MTWRPATLIEASRRIAAGEAPSHALSEFLDEFYGRLRRQDSAGAQAAIDDEPLELPDAQVHAYLGGVGEHLALRWALTPPTWVHNPSRFLKRPYFTSRLDGLKAMCLAQSPLAFRRRMIFTEAEPLRRASLPRAPDGRPLRACELSRLATAASWDARAHRRARMAAGGSAVS